MMLEARLDANDRIQRFFEAYLPGSFDSFSRCKLQQVANPVVFYFTIISDVLVAVMRTSDDEELHLNRGV